MKFDDNEDLFNKINQKYDDDNGDDEEKEKEEYGNLTSDQFEQELIKKFHFKATRDTEDRVSPLRKAEKLM